MAELCGRSPLATLAVNEREIEKRAYAPQLERFAAAITAALDRKEAGASQDPAGEMALPTTFVRRAS